MNVSEILAFLSRVLPELRRFIDDRVGPAEVQARIAEIAREEGQRADVVWERDDLAERYHYDALLAFADGTLSVAYCPDGETPWPLRGAHRWSEQHVVQVNGQLKTIEHVAGWLEWCLWRDPGVSLRLVDHCLVELEVKSRGLRASETEIQAGLDAYRARRGLTTAAQYHEWLRANGLAQAEVESLVELEICTARLREDVVGRRAAEYFADHAREFDRVTAFRCRLGDETAARGVVDRVRRGETSLFQEASRSAARSENRSAFVSYRRGELSGDLGKALFGARPGEIVGPLPGGDGVEVVEIIEHAEANFEEARASVVALLFDQWLREKRRDADIRWFWGRSEAASPGLDPP
jgi:putative peptide maturation system protein